MKGGRALNSLGYEQAGISCGFLQTRQCNLITLNADILLSSWTRDVCSRII